MIATRFYAFGLLFFVMSWLGYDHYRPWVNFHSESLAFFGLFCLIASALLYRRQQSELPHTSAWVALIALLPWLQYATGISLFAGDALMSSLYLSGLLGAGFVGFSLCRGEVSQAERGITGLMHCIWVAAMISGAIGLAQWFNVQGPLGMYVVQSDFGDRAMGNLGQANQLASLLILGTVALAYVYERGKIGTMGFFAGAGFMTGVLVLTQSRSGLLSVIVVALLMFWKKKATQLRVKNPNLVFWVVFTVVGNLLLPAVSTFLMIGESRNLVEGNNIGSRWMMWQQVGSGILQSPWFGYGWNQTPTAHAAGVIAFPGAHTFTHAHNFVMDMVAWNGIPLGLLLSGVIAYWFVSRIRSSRRTEAIYAMAGLLPIAVHSMLEFPFAYAYFLITCGFMVGIVEACMPAPKAFSFKPQWGWAVMLTWALVGSYLIYEYFLIEEDFRVVRFENLKIGQTPPTYKVPDVWMMSHMATMLKASRLRAHPGMSSEEIEMLRSSSARFAYGALRFRYAQALALNGDLKGAVSQMAIVRGMYGEAYYAGCKVALREQSGQYPLLAALLSPD